MKPRHTHIDVLKALLILGMIFEHVPMLLGSQAQPVYGQELNFALGTVSYSAFLFCFGYAAQLAYFSEGPNLKRVSLSAARILAGYYISALAAIFFYIKQYDVADLLQVLTFSKWALFAEFVPSFGLALILAALFHRPLQYLLDRPLQAVGVSALLLLTTLIPPQLFDSARWALFFGVPETVAFSFPLFAYFPVYLWGMYVAHHQIKPRLFNTCAAMAGVILFYLWRFLFGTPTRFPPSILYILSTACFVFVWYAAANKIDQWKFGRDLLAPIGANALFYLVISNILIFALKGAAHVKLSFTEGCTYALGIILICYFLTGIVHSPRTPQNKNSEKV